MKKCISCGEQITGRGKTGFCLKCVFKGKRSPIYKNGVALKQHYCKEPNCKNKISIPTVYTSGLCRSCAVKKKNVWNKGKKMSKKHKENLKKSLTGRKLSKKHKESIRKALIGRTFTKEYKEKMSLSRMGNKNPMYGKHHKREAKERIRIKNSLSRLGKNNPNWKGGILPEYKYPSFWNKELKETIRKRDNYTCQVCGCPQKECDRALDVHHIDFNEKNLDENNLISLCRYCHNKTKGNKKHWIKLLLEKIKNKPCVIRELK